MAGVGYGYQSIGTAARRAPRKRPAAVNATSAKANVVKTVVIRRAPLHVFVGTDHAVVIGLEPVAAEGVIGYGPTVKSAMSGFTVDVTVGAGEEDDAGTQVHLTGQVTQVELARHTGPDGAGEHAKWLLDLPQMATRSVQASLYVPYGDPHVLAVVPGFDESEGFVIAVAVRKLPAVGPAPAAMRAK